MCLRGPKFKETKGGDNFLWGECCPHTLNKRLGNNYQETESKENF